MSTPITDAVAKQAFPNETTSDYSGYVTMMLHARRLELDRAALMEALSQIIGDLPQRRDWLDPDLEAFAKSALTAARANFPQP